VLTFDEPTLSTLTIMPTPFEPLDVPEGLMRAVVSAYATPPRAYHSFSHVQEVLSHLATVPTWERPAEVLLAALFHDAVYVAGRKDNEARSAELAADAITTFLPRAGLDVARVRHLIGLTARHGALTVAEFVTDPDAAHFLDADMAILGSAPEAFDAYDAAIAEEYRPVTNALLYRFGRRRFLSKLLDAERIYLSDVFHARLDAAARANLRRALARP
jgi:predicted metal-dependent HD superfamily phosphohydrolase